MTYTELTEADFNKRSFSILSLSKLVEVKDVWRRLGLFLVVWLDFKIPRINVLGVSPSIILYQQ